MAGFFDLEPLIVARLKEQLGTLVKDVLVTEELQGVVEQQQIVPAVHLVYKTYTIESKTKTLTALRQQWYLIAAARNVRNLKAGTEARKEVAPLIDGIFNACQGWSPPDCKGRWCEPEQPGINAVITDGFIYVPTLWSFPWVMGA